MISLIPLGNFTMQTLLLSRSYPDLLSCGCACGISLKQVLSGVSLCALTLGVQGLEVIVSHSHRSIGVSLTLIPASASKMYMQGKLYLTNLRNSCQELAFHLHSWWLKPPILEPENVPSWEGRCGQCKMWHWRAHVSLKTM